MKLNQIAPVIVTSIFLAGCTNSSTKVTIDTSKQTSTENAKAALKIGQIIASGGQAVCTVKSLDQKTQSTKMTISGKKMKIEGVAGEGMTNGVMINDGTYTYFYEDGAKVGFKMKNPDQVETNKANSVPNDLQPNPDKYVSDYEDESKYQMECEQKTIPDSEFVPPTTITFTDPAAMMNNQLKNLPSIPTGR